jgi:hypothetical protein
VNTEKKELVREEPEPYGFWILASPIFGMAALIGFLALLMRSTGKW